MKNPLLRYLAVALLAGCAGAPVAPARVHIDSTDVPYPVVGDTAEEILEQLKAQAARNGTQYLADTRWDMNTNLQYSEPAAGGCRVRSAVLTLKLRTSVPEWNRPVNAPRELSRKWSAFLAGVRRHERGHADHAKAAARDLGAALATLRADDCETLSLEAGRVQKDILDRYHALDEKYDADTGHGVQQGALWTVVRKK